jgi:hypothetical protein
MDFVVFVDSNNDNLVEQIRLPNDKIIDLTKKGYDFSEMSEFIGYNFSILYSNGKIENANLISVGKTEDGEPTFDYGLLDDRKGEVDNE